MRVVLSFALLIFVSVPALAEQGLVSWWTFDDGNATDKVLKIEDQITGNFKFFPEGAKG
jgi:hypothetical protein